MIKPQPHNAARPLRGLSILDFDILACVIVFIVLVGWLPVLDPDFFWHLKTGEVVVAERALLTRETFSHTAFDQPITVTGWFFDVLLYSVWELAGEVGVKVLMAIFLTATWFVMYKTARLYIARIESSVLLTLMGFGLFSGAFAPRPNLFTHLGFAIVLYLLLRTIHSGNSRTLLWLIPLFAVWPNFHYGFAAAFLLIGLFLASAILDRIDPLIRCNDTASLLSPVALGGIAAALVATLANPYGWDIYPELLQMTSGLSVKYCNTSGSPPHLLAYCCDDYSRHFSSQAR